MGACAGGFYETLLTMALEASSFGPVDNPSFNKRLIRVRREFLSSRAGPPSRPPVARIIPAGSMTHNLRNVQNLSIILCGNFHLLNCVSHLGDTKNQGLWRCRRLPGRCADLPERLSRLAVLASL